MNWSEPEVQAAIIQAIAVVIAAIAAAMIGNAFADRKKLQRKLITATQDIEFLLAVEALHCAQHVKQRGESMKYRVRAEAKKDGKLKWSGQFTPGRVNDSPTMQNAQLACENSAG